MDVKLCALKKIYFKKTLMVCGFYFFILYYYFTLFFFFNGSYLHRGLLTNFKGMHRHTATDALCIKSRLSN